MVQCTCEFCINIQIPGLGKCAIDCCKVRNFKPLLVKFAQEVSTSALARRDVRELEQLEGNTNLICILAKKNLSLLIALLVNNGFPVNYELDEKLRTLLIIASEYGYSETVSFLLGKGANVHKFDIHFMTPLHYAAKHNHFIVVKKLVECGANVNAQTDAGYTPLHYACKNECNEVMEYLVMHDADVSIRNSLGKSAAQYAREGFALDFINSYR